MRPGRPILKSLRRTGIIGASFCSSAPMKPAIVLLHSSMSSKAQWATLVDQLAPDFRSIPLDLLGYGAAPYPQGAAP